MTCAASSAWGGCGSGRGDQCVELWATLVELEKKESESQGKFDTRDSGL